MSPGNVTVGQVQNTSKSGKVWRKIRKSVDFFPQKVGFWPKSVKKCNFCPKVQKKNPVIFLMESNKFYRQSFLQNIL